ncbi:type II secretion system protein GspL [Cedecea sp.]|jgi:general secretion pathway protein L|uniref:type II secretion system protein GspL n=1 Tax=Cedecea sp. TaxID=1970739 RepID=UPI002F3EDDA4
MKKKRLAQILIRIPPEAGSPWRWRYHPTQGEPLEGEFSDSSLTHNLPADNVELILLLPATHVLFRQVNFSGKVRRHGPQALLWQLEDFTLSDIEQLHLTLLDRQGERYALAAVDKIRLKQWLTKLSTWGLRPQRALPDVLALPVGSAVMLGREWLIRNGEHEGFIAAEHELTLLPLPQPIVCHSPCPVACAAWLQGTQQAPLALLMQGATQCHCNLLQGEFAIRQDLPAVKWRYLSLALAVCWLLSFVVEPLLAGWQAQRHTERLQQQGVAFYQRYFTDAPSPTQTRRQLTQHIAKLQAELPKPSLLALLAQSHNLLNALPEPQALNWDGELLTLTLPISEAKLLPLLEQHRQTAVSLITRSDAADITLLTMSWEPS